MNIGWTKQAIKMTIWSFVNCDVNFSLLFDILQTNDESPSTLTKATSQNVFVLHARIDAGDLTYSYFFP